MDAARPCVLVIDDDPGILTLMRHLLAHHGFEPLVARTEAEALEIVRGRRPDLILLDMQLAGVGGDEVIESIRTVPGIDDVPVLVLSGSAVSESRLRSFGAAGAMQKPLDVPTIVRQIRAHLAPRE